MPSLDDSFMQRMPGLEYVMHTALPGPATKLFSSQVAFTPQHTNTTWHH